MASIIEDHPQRDEIDRLILAGKSLRMIAGQCIPAVSHNTIQDYRRKILKHLIPKAAQAVVKEAVAAAKSQGVTLTNMEATDGYDRRTGLATPLVQRLAVKQQRRERWMQIAEKNEDIRGFAALDTADTRDIELEARLTGALDVQPVNVNVNHLIVVPNNNGQSIHPPSSAGGQVIDISAE